MSTTRQKGRFPWLRLALLALYVVAILGFVLYERAAHQILGKAAELQHRSKYGAASVAYKLVVERYPFSVAVPQARAGVSAIQPAAERSAVPGRLRRTWLEGVLSDKMNPYVVDQLPMIGWTCSAAVLFLVFVSRIARRPGWAVLALFFGAISAFGGTLLLGIGGFIPIAWAAEIVAPLEPILLEPTAVYVATWIALATAALLTLSPVSRRAQQPAAREEPAQQPRTDSAGQPRATPDAPATATVDTVAARLQKLDDLRSRDLITNDEYQRERERLLEGI